MFKRIRIDSPCFHLLILIITSSALGAPPQFVISGFVQTSGVMGVAGANVAGDNGATSVVTGADGAYSITVPNKWDGTIAVTKAGWLITPASKTYTDVRSSIANENYTAYQPTISGCVRKTDGTVLSGATVSASGGGSATTNASGYFEIMVPYGWSGTVSISLCGYNFTARNYTNVTADQANQDFAGYQPKISGFVKKTDGTALVGAVVTATGEGSTAADNSGYYEIVVSYGWAGALTASLPGYSFAARNYTNVATEQENQNFTGYQPTISGYTNFQAGVTVAASGVGTTVSDSSYYYSITVPYGWSGTLTASLTGYYFAAKHYTNVTANLTNQSFTAFQPKISGFVRKVNGTSVSGATITAFGTASTVSNSGGFYSLTLPYGYSDDITVSLAEYGFIESPKHVENLTSNLTQDFTAYKPMIYGILKDYKGSPMSGIVISASNVGIYVTDSGGYYGITVPYGWSGTVTVGLPAVTDSPKVFTNVTAQYVRQDFEEVRYRISGHVMTRELKPVLNTTLYALGHGTVLTNSNGYYEFWVYPGWSGTIRASDEYSNYRYIPEIRDINSVMADLPEQNHLAWQPRITGRVTDLDGNPVSGVEIRGGFGTAPTTGMDGGYVKYIPYISRWSWNRNITPAKEGYIFEPPDRQFPILETDAEQDFLMRRPRISGFVTLTYAANPVRDVNVLLTGIGNGMTDAYGLFSFDVPKDWYGTMTLQKDGLETKSITFTYVTADVNAVYRMNLNYGGGDGSEANPFRIGTAEHLFCLSRQYEHFGKSFVLVCDIDMKEQADFEGIGAYEPGLSPFSGSFDGSGYVVRNLSIRGDMQMEQVGLFNYVKPGSGKTSVIKNVGLVDASVTGGYAPWGSGSLAGRIEGSDSSNVLVEDCWSEGGKLEGEKHIGGLLGFVGSNVTVRNCFASTAVQTNNGGGGLIGCLMGGRVSNCVAICDVNTTMFDVGGLIGIIYGGDVNDCYARGSVRGEYESGGFAGVNLGGRISRCYVSCTVSGQRNTGSFVGQAGNPLPVFEGCFWDSDICQDINGIGNAASAGVVAKSSAEMRSAGTFIASGWDFAGETANGTADIWTICEGTNTPRFVWQVAPADFLCPDGVDSIDLAFFAQQWLLSDCILANDYCEGADIDASGHVDIVDFAIFAGQWLEGT